MIGTIKLRPVGVIRNEYRKALRPYDPTYFERLESTIILEERHLPGLLGLEVGMRLDVLSFLDKAEREEFPYTLHPRGDPANPLTGLWNSRSPHRPNPIAVSTVTIKRIEKNKIVVTGLDAFDGTPIIDLKRPQKRSMR